MGSYGGHFLVVDSIKWAILRPQTESLHFETQRLLFPSSANIVREPCPTTIFTFFSFFWLTLFVASDVLRLFHIDPYRNPTVWFFICCHLSVNSILFVSYWGPMAATFSSRILPSGLKCARELRASNLKHKDCCSHQLQTWFVEGNIVRQLDSRFLSFWLANWGGPKMKTFTVNVERQRQKNIGEILQW